MGKLEKLKEINKTLKKILIDMETRIFIEADDAEKNKKIKESKPKAIIETNQ